jgi:glycosyltransferase involved in cell wall biosynthesis
MAITEGCTAATPVVFVVDASVAVTGAFVSVRNIANVLRGSARVVLILPAESDIDDTELADFWAVHRLRLGRLKKSIPSLLFYVPCVLVSSWQISRLMRASGATRLQINDFYLPHGAVCRVLGFRGRVVTWVRIDPARFGRIISTAFLYLASLSSDRLVAVSKFIQSRLSAVAATTLVYDCAQRTSMTPECQSVARVRRLVYIGNYIPGKGQDDALAVFASLARDFPDVVLEFWGGDMGLQKNREYRKSLQEAAVRLAVSDRTQFYDFAKDTGAVLRGAYAALNFSRSESFSMTVLEAASQGLPVVATRSGGPAEIISDGVTGLLVAVGDRTGMESALRSLLRAPEIARALGHAAREDTQNRFSVDQFISGVSSALDLHACERRQQLDRMQIPRGC